MSLFFTNYGYNPHFSVTTTSSSRSIIMPTTQKLADRFQKLHEDLVETLKSTQNNQAKYYDAKH